MCKLTAIKKYVTLSICFAIVKTEVTNEKEEYSVLVSFSQNVKYKDGRFLIEKFKASLQDSSSILYNAIGRHFTKATFKIPDSWDISEWNITTNDVSIAQNTKADFLIDNSNDIVFGKFPYSQQYGSCGTPGYQIIIPTGFFSEANTIPQGIVLAREWLKYRYGVFDENGYKGDPLYPMYYVLPGNDQNKVKITDCTNVPVVYNFKDKSEVLCSENDQSLIKRLDTGDCSIIPDKESLENVTSSLMYFQRDIVNMQHICGKDSHNVHNAMSPNKHNAMCRGQSVWDIVKTSEDFQNETAVENYEDIEFVYIKESKPKILIAWENTANISSIKGPILNSIKRLIYDLPDKSKFGGFPFSNTLSEDKDYTLRDLNTLKDKNDIMANILSDFVKDTYGDINLAVSKALDILSSDGSNPESEATVIIITVSSGKLDNTVIDRLLKSKVCVIILYLSGDSVPDEIRNSVSALPCGSLEHLEITDDKEDMFNNLFSTMESVLPETVDDKRTETVTTGYLTKDSSLTFHVDETVENVTFWVFTDKESENFELKFNQENEKFKRIRTTAIMALSFSPSKDGSIEFSYPHETSPIFTQVRFTSKAGKYIKGYVFTHDTSENSSLVQMPVIIYAMIRFGAYPVQNAIVLATVKAPSEQNITFELFDDGRGDPDITQNDGIYSRYFTQFTEMGEYTVTVTVHTDDFSRYGIDENAGYQTCCGSFVKTSISSKLPAFSKIFKATFYAKNGRPDDGYKPSRILDLRIDSVLDDKIILKWSAPGEEGDSGTASQYEIKLFCGEENTTDCEIHKMITVLNQTSPSNYGEPQEVTIQILIKTHILSVGIISYNGKNKMSDLSNIIQINGLPETTEVTTIVTDTSTEKRSSLSAIISSTIVCILLLIALIIAIVYYSRRKSKYKKRKDSEIQQNINTDEQIKISFNAPNPSIKTAPMKRIESFPVMLYTHDQIKDCRDREKYPPLYKTDIQPRPWASLDVVSSLRTADSRRDTKSLGSSSTVDVNEESENKEIK